MSKSYSPPSWGTYAIICLIMTVILVVFAGMRNSIGSIILTATLSGVVFLIYWYFHHKLYSNSHQESSYSDADLQPTPTNKNPSVSTAYEISDFFFMLQNDSDYMEYLHNQVNGLEELDKFSKSELIDGNDNRHILVFFSDFIKAFTKMGHQFSYRHAKTVPLSDALLYIYRRTQPEIDAQGANRSKLLESARKILSQMSNVKCTSMTNDYEFVTPTILEAAEMPQTAERFNKLMLKFCKEISYVDLYPNESETKYIEGLKRYIAGSRETIADKAESSKALKELDGLIGLDAVKKEITTLVNFIKVQQMRQKKGLKTTPVSYHCVFTGNPGTGKTTVARILADIYRELGIVKRGQLIETDRSGLVAEYVGQTAVKTNKKIDEALDGVLFIDEAYSLVPSSSDNDFGQEAISTLLKRIEDDRDRLVVVLAGYGDEMRRFIESNPGLESRFNRYINFEDYNGAELTEMFKKLAEKNEYILDDGALRALEEIAEKLVRTKDRHFGNARTIRNLFEKTIERQAHRLAQDSPETLNSIALQTIKAIDFK